MCVLVEVCGYCAGAWTLFPTEGPQGWLVPPARLTDHETEAQKGELHSKSCDKQAAEPRLASAHHTALLAVNAQKGGCWLASASASGKSERLPSTLPGTPGGALTPVEAPFTPSSPHSHPSLASSHTNLPHFLPLSTLIPTPQSLEMRLSHWLCQVQAEPGKR